MEQGEPSPQPGLSLGIDIGTGGVRCAVLDGAGRVVSMARAPHAGERMARPDANAWWHVVQVAVRAQLDALRGAGVNGAEIARLCVAGTSGSMVMCDAALRPVTRALMYDSGGFHDEAARIARHAPNPHITRGSASALARALRLVSEAGEAGAHLMHQADFVAAQFMRRAGVSDYNNALKTGFDPACGGWPDWIGAAGVSPARLPHVVEPGQAIGVVHADVARALGLCEGVRVHAGTTDSSAAFIAAAPRRAGAAVTSLGTTLAVKVLSPRPVNDPEIGLYSHKLGAHWLVGGASNTGGGVLARFFDAPRLRELSRRIDPSVASPYEYYPLNAPGERFPINDPALAPRMTPRPDDEAAFLHGLLEGMARIEAQCYREIESRGGPQVAALFTAGGGASNEVWRAIRARVLGVTPQPARHTEACVGAARLAAAG